MIPAHGWEAGFTRTLQTKDADGQSVTVTEWEPVVAWDDDGDALIVTERARRLTPACDAGNFVGLRQSEGRVVAAVPGQGWVVEWPAAGYRSPLLGWLIRENGDVQPFDVDRNGYVEELRFCKGWNLIPPFEERADAPFP